jgi:hypothetical protein
MQRTCHDMKQDSLYQMGCSAKAVTLNAGDSTGGK